MSRTDVKTVGTQQFFERKPVVVERMQKPFERMQETFEQIYKPFEWLIKCFERIFLGVRTDNKRITNVSTLETDNR